MQDRDAHLAALEADDERYRREDERAFDARIALAECGALGHLPPAPGADTVEIVAWGSSEPLRSGPSCRRCGASLNPPEGNENAPAGVRMFNDVTHSNRATPARDGRPS